MNRTEQNSKRQTRGLTVDSDFLVDTIFQASIGPFVFINTCTIHEGVKLSIEPGSNFIFMSSAQLVVRGELHARGRPDAPITFSGTSAQQSGPMTGTGIVISSEGSPFVNVSHATFTGLQVAVSIECCANSVALFENCVFTRNVYGSLGYGGSNTFRGCEFSYHTNAAAVGGDLVFENCYFHDQPQGAAAAGSVFDSCVFLNHSEAAVSGGSVQSSLFVNNAVAVSYDGSMYGPDVTDSIILSSVIGVQAGNGAVITGGWICGLQQQDTSALIEVVSSSDAIVSGVWFGSSPENISLIRGCIKDAYWSEYAGLAELEQLASQPPAWPISEQRYYAKFASLCTPPPNRGLNMNRPPSGILFENTLWTSALTNVVSSAVIIAEGVTLTIEAGSTVAFTTTGAQVVVKGRLVAAGRPDAPITFSGTSAQQSGPMTGTGIVISSEGSPFVNVSHATFTGLQVAVSIECCANSVALFENCVFTRNVYGSLGYGGSNTFRGCEFSYHTNAAAVGGDLVFENCYFHDQPQGAAAAGSVFDSCVFLNHSEAAVSGGSVQSSLFVNNAVAVSYDGSMYGPSVSYSTIVDGSVGIIVGKQSFLSDVNICDNSELNVNVLIGQNFGIFRSWLGTSSTFLAQQSMRAMAGAEISINLPRSHPLPLPRNLPLPTILSAVSRAACILFPCDSIRTCNGRGICNAGGSCVCMSSWSGDFCERCDFVLNSDQCLPPCSAILTCEACALRQDCLTCAGTGLCSSIYSTNSTEDACTYFVKGCQRENHTNIHATASVSESINNIVISFSMPTNMGGYAAGENVDCLLFFDFKTIQQFGWDPFCIFVSSTLLSVHLGTSFSADIFREGLVFRAGTIKDASGMSELSNDIVELPYPSSLPIPKAVLKAPSKQTSCLPLVLDTSMSMDSLGRLSVEWQCIASCADNLQVWLSQATESIITIPTSFLMPDQIYMVQANVINEWGVVSSAVANVEIVPGESIFVSLSQQGGRLFLYQKAVPGTANIAILKCNGQNVPAAAETKTNSTFRWVLSTFEGSILLESNQSIFVIQPLAISVNLSDSNPLNLSLTVSAPGYVSGFVSMSVLKARVLNLPSWLDFSPAALTLPRTARVLIGAEMLPSALFQHESISLSCTWRCLTELSPISNLSFVGDNMTECSVKSNAAFNLFAPSKTITLAPEFLYLNSTEISIAAASCRVAGRDFLGQKSVSALFRFKITPEHYPIAAIYVVSASMLAPDPATGERVVSFRAPLILSAAHSENDTCSWSLQRWNAVAWVEDLTPAVDDSGFLTFPTYSFQPWTMYKVVLTVSRHLLSTKPSQYNSSGGQSEFSNQTTEILNSSTSFQFMAGSVFGKANLSITPNSGTAYLTLFNFAVTEISVSSVDGVTFKFGFSCDTGEFLWNDGGTSTQSSLQTILPPGFVTVWVEIHDISGDFVTVRVNHTVEVAPLATLTLQSVSELLASFNYSPSMVSALIVTLSATFWDEATLNKQELNQLITLLLNTSLGSLSQQPASMTVSDMLSGRLLGIQQILNVSFATSDRRQIIEDMEFPILAAESVVHSVTLSFSSAATVNFSMSISSLGSANSRVWCRQAGMGYDDNIIRGRLFADFSCAIGVGE